MVRRKAIAVWLTALLALVGTACGSGGVEEKAGGSLTIYSGRSEKLIGPLIERFEAETGVVANVRYGDTAEMASLLAEEGDRTPADVFWAQDAGALGAVERDGAFAELPDAILDRVAAENRSASGRWVGVSGRVRVIAYSPDRVREAELPASVEGLTGARWRGKVGWAPTNGSFQSFVTAFRQIEGEAAAAAWLRAMEANGTKVYAKNDAIVKAIASGEIDAGLVNHYYPSALRKQEPDASVAVHFLPDGDVGGLVNVAGAGVLATSENRGAAERFISFLLTEPSQRFFVDETFEYPLVAGVEAAAGLPALASLRPPTVDLSRLADLEGTLRLLTEVGLL
jgi:iron(III) transport system substrate-binding protein